MSKFISPALALIAAALLAGCSMQGDSSGMAHHKIVISTNGGDTTVFEQAADGSVDTYSTKAGATACEQCKADAKKYFDTGTLTEKCPSCGAIHHAGNSI